MKGTGADRRMPLLEEVFEAFPHIPMNVDIKDDDDMLIEKVVVRFRCGTSCCSLDLLANYVERACPENGGWILIDKALQS